CVKDLRGVRSVESADAPALFASCRPTGAGLTGDRAWHLGGCDRAAGRRILATRQTLIRELGRPEHGEDLVLLSRGAGSTRGREGSSHDDSVSRADRATGGGRGRAYGTDLGARPRVAHADRRGQPTLVASSRHSSGKN